MPSQPRALFITGTDTGVGKTWVAASLVRSLRAAGHDAVGFKPVLCGPDRDDAEALLAASLSGEKPAAGLTLDTVNPVWLPHPVAPLAAPLLGDDRPVDLCAILDTWELLARRHECIIIEGAGGWEVPLDTDRTFATLARDFAAPVLVVAANRLGVLNHTKLTVDAIVRAGLPCAGIVLNETAPPDPDDPARRTNLAVLRQLFPSLSVSPLGLNEPASADLCPAIGSRR